MVRTFLVAAFLLAGAAGLPAEEAVPVPKVPLATARANAKGNALLEQGEFEAAAKVYRDEALKRPENSVLQQNLAGALARSNQMDEGLAAYSQALRFAETPQSRAGVLHDLGNALATGGQLEPALQTYMAGLLLDPEDMDLRHNYELVLQRLQEQQQQEQQSENPERNEGNQDQEQEPQPDQQEDPQEQPDPQQDQQEQQSQDQQQSEELEQAQPDDTEQMSPEDAQRLLDAMLEEEKELQAERSREMKPRDPNVEKDW